MLPEIVNRNIESDLFQLSSEFEGDIFTDQEHRILYSTDASAYRQIPNAVVYPKNTGDIQLLVRFAKNHNSSLIPRTAGTSLAGQVVGGGIVADVSKYMTKIIQINPEEKWVKVQPGVVLDELNQVLEPYGLFFSPETSTSNRCMIGGMVGNNSCGAHSLIYGSTRDHLISVSAVLSDTSVVTFEPINAEAFAGKSKLKTLEGDLYRQIALILNNPENRQEILSEFPDKSIKRRNTGYALDLLMDAEPFGGSDNPFNFSKLLAGSEGTLAFITEITLSLDPLPPPVKGLVCVHCNTLEEALKGNLIALKFNPGAVELMDNTIMELSKTNISQSKNRFFIAGNPAAVLIIEFARQSREEILEIAGKMESELRRKGYGYHFPVIFGGDISKVWEVRKAGLGLLSNMPGDAKPVPVVEDAAVRPEDLPGYINDFKEILTRYNLNCVYYAHIGTGELHLRPVLNLKDKKDVELFHTVALDTAKLVKKYKGSLSGEHGDGRLRGEFIPMMIGGKNYNILRQIKRLWDPENIFNPGKIIDTPPMNTSLKFKPGFITPELKTYFDFSEDRGFLRSIEKCNGSGDCRKSELIGGTMCPSFMATRDERTTTRARANLLRELISNPEKENPFDQEAIFSILDLCLSCKGCKSECPSNVDMAKLKAEFMQHYYDANRIPLRTRMVAGISKINGFGSRIPRFINFILSNRITSGWIKKLAGFAPERHIPKLYRTTLKNYLGKNAASESVIQPVKGQVYFFADEFTNFNDTEIGIKAIEILNRMGYRVILPDHEQSGRTYLSKGLVRKAKDLAEKNVNLLKDVISSSNPLIGIEPSAILTFRDEYPVLVSDELRDHAENLGKSVMMFDEFITAEMGKGNISRELFTKEKRKIRIHGHCHQKALASVKPTLEMLSLPVNYETEEIRSGCCGMAGSFGFEKEHYEISMKIGELVLFPEVRKTEPETIIAAPGTSCRQQIMDGTGRRVYHPVEILYDALIN
jgi:FAD/FMN-containing dehydrogenase/Fe-S oxidoreductase